MSHFLFGVAQVARGQCQQDIGQGIQVSWGAAGHQQVVTEMLEEHGKPEPNETLFCVAFAGEDNADALVSPYQLEASRIVDRISYVLAWLDRERAGANAELWITEGYDDSFKECQGTYEQVVDSLRKVTLFAEQLPSLRLKLTC